MLNKHFFAVILTATALIATPALADDDGDDDDDYRPRSAQVAKSSAKATRATARISAQQAGKNAQNSLKNSRVRKVEYDHDDRHGAVYEVELIKGGLKYDAKVNAKTGRVIYVKRDD